MQLAVESLKIPSICPQSTVEDYECRAQQHCAQCQSGNNGDDTVMHTIVRHAMLCPIWGFSTIPLNATSPGATAPNPERRKGPGHGYDFVKANKRATPFLFPWADVAPREW